MSEEKKSRKSREQVQEGSPGTERAMASVTDAVKKLGHDPLQPAYHFRAPAQWMNDPTGTIYHDGWYHMFYQHNPYGDVWGHMHWGHARSRDLVHWEHLPIALAPAEELGESGVWSGCAFVGDDGKPRIFYTSIGHDRNELDAAQQWVAESDDEMIRWVRPDCNPVMAEDLHRGQKVYDWRDPYMFRHDGSIYMIMGGNLNRRVNGGGVVVMYRAADESLTNWDYLGVLYRHHEVDVVQFDCPNLFQVGSKWVLVYSPWHGSIRYMTGTMDFDEPRFTPETSGMFDYGPDLFATNTLYDPDGRLVVFAWVRGFKERRGWQGCISLPRTMSLGEQGELYQEPCSELAQLRRKTFTYEAKSLDGEWVVPDVKGDTLEIECTFELASGAPFGIKLCHGGEGGKEWGVIRHDGHGVSIDGCHILAVRKHPGEALTFRIYKDRSVIELFVENGRYTMTRVIYPAPDQNRIQFFSEGGETRIKNLSIHRLADSGVIADWPF